MPSGTRRHTPDQGSATPWAIGLVAIIALLSGIVLDGGNAMAARIAALDIAQQAARAGANCLDTTHLRETSQVRLDPAAAETTARHFLNHTGATGTVTATTTDISVTIHRDHPTLLLTIIGIDTIHTTATATATPVTTYDN